MREQFEDWNSRFCGKVIGLGMHHAKHGYDLAQVRPASGTGVYVTVKGARTSRQLYSLILRSLASVNGIRLPEGYENLYVERRMAVMQGVPHPERWADCWRIFITAFEKAKIERMVLSQEPDDESFDPPEVFDENLLGAVADNEEASGALRVEVERQLNAKSFKGALEYSHFVAVAPQSQSLMVLVRGLRGTYEAQTAMSTLADNIGAVTGVFLYDATKLRFAGHETTEGRYAVLINQEVPRHRPDAEDETE